MCFGPQVERIVDKRRNKKGKWEYLIRWKGYGSKEDTWEPEHHLLHCEEFIDRFNSLRLHSRKRPKVPNNQGGQHIPGHSAATENTRARSDAPKKKRTSGPAVGVRVGSVLGIGRGVSGATHRQKKAGVGAGKHALGDKMSKPMTYKAPPSREPHFVPLLRVSHNGLQNGEAEPLVYRTAARSHKLLSDRDEEVEHKDTTGSQFTTELGKILSKTN